MDTLILPPSLGILDTSSQRVMPKHIKAWLTLSQPDFPASPSRLQENNEETKTNETCGPGQLPLLSASDRDPFCLKMCREYVDICPWSIVTCVELATKFNDLSFYRPGMSGHRICEKGYGLWRTPTKHEASGGPHKGKRHRPDATVQLRDQVANPHMWPTPREQDHKHGGATKWELESGRDELHIRVAKEEVKKWPTPKRPTGGGQIERTTSGGGIRKLEDKVSQSIGKNTGQLNPEWVEWLMGWPVGWSSLEPITEFLWLDWSVDPADDDNFLKRKVEGKVSTPKLGTAVKMWSTPNVCGNYNRKGASKTSGDGLATQVAKYPTPQAFDAYSVKDGNRENRLKKGGCRNLNQEIKVAGFGPIPRVATGIKNRVNRLKAIGNGQVPAVVVAAWKILTCPH